MTKVTKVPIVRSDNAPAFELPGIVVTGFAAPARGSSETTTFRLALDVGAALPEHRHDHEEVVHVVDGAVVQVLDGKEHEVASGDTVIIPAGTMHYAFTRTGSATLLCAMPAGTRMIRTDGSDSVPPWGE